MKIRTDFVTNSSSSSFIINKRDLTERQLEAIRNHRTSGLEYADTDYWDIEENDDYITGNTWLDNFSMYELFEIINVDLHFVLFDEYTIDVDDKKAQKSVDKLSDEWHDELKYDREHNDNDDLDY